MQGYHTLSVLLLAATLGACNTAQDAKPGATSTAVTPDLQISEYVRRVYQDRQGNFWFGTNGDRAARYDGESLDFLRFDFKDDNTLRQRVWSLDDSGRTLVLDLLHRKIRS